ncbi:MAG: formate/nitrite transporter family protein [Cocleimonas sp.]
MNKESNQSDAYPPSEIARRVEHLGETKAHTETLTLLVLAILAGAFISMGALFFTVVITGSNLGFGLTRFIGGLSFSLGLILVIVAGAELFTGNNLIAMAWASGRIGIREVIRNWTLVYIGNVIGCLGTVLLVLLCDIASLDNGSVGETAISIARAKGDLTLIEAFTRGILCNVFVCLAVWLAIGARSVTDKILAIIFPITAFVVIGLEHSIANWFFLPFGLALDLKGEILVADAINNIIVVSVGNIIGGTLLVAGVYWVAYLRGERNCKDQSK